MTGRVFCRNCGAEMLNSDIFCSKCGTRLEPSTKLITNKVKLHNRFISKKMTWVIIMILCIGALCFFLTLSVLHSNLCSESSKISPTTVASSTQNTAPQDPTLAKVYTLEGIKAGNYQVSDVQNNQNSQFACFLIGNQYDNYTAPTGDNYLKVALMIVNRGPNSISTNPDLWKLTANDVSYTPNVATSSIKQPLSQVEHGDMAKVELIYLVKGNPQTVQLTYTG